MEETKEIKEQNNRLFLLLSIMIMEFSNAKTENDILQGLLNLVKKLLISKRWFSSMKTREKSGEETSI